MIKYSLKKDNKQMTTVQLKLSKTMRK